MHSRGDIRAWKLAHFAPVSNSAGGRLSEYAGLAVRSVRTGLSRGRTVLGHTTAADCSARVPTNTVRDCDPTAVSSRPMVLQEPIEWRAEHYQFMCILEQHCPATTQAAHQGRTFIQLLRQRQPERLHDRLAGRSINTETASVCN
jgi:hypothetical protein